MLIPFFKYQGTGNDFILVDGRMPLELDAAQIARMCDRHFGIGSDGLIILQSSASSDFYMNFYNPDGSQSFCGNGSRCAVRLAQSLGMCSTEGTFDAIDGTHMFRSDSDQVQIKMRDVSQVESQGADRKLHTGSPHYIRFVDDAETADLMRIAHGIRYSDLYRLEGINVNLVERTSDGIRMRTYERGVEDETLSCGTGVTAAAIAASLPHNGQQKMNVITRGGVLSVIFERMNDQFNDIWLCGPAELVFSGQYTI